MGVTAFILLLIHYSFRTTLQVGILEKAGVPSKGEKKKKVLGVLPTLFRTPVPERKRAPCRPVRRAGQGAGWRHCVRGNMANVSKS